jgi:hypothetical protein
MYTMSKQCAAWKLMRVCMQVGTPRTYSARPVGECRPAYRSTMSKQCKAQKLMRVCVQVQVHHEQTVQGPLEDAGVCTGIP